MLSKWVRGWQEGGVKGETGKEGERRERKRKAVRDFSVTWVVNVALYIQFLFLEVHQLSHKNKYWSLIRTMFVKKARSFILKSVAGLFFNPRQSALPFHWWALLVPDGLCSSTDLSQVSLFAYCTLGSDCLVATSGCKAGRPISALPQPCMETPQTYFLHWARLAPRRTLLSDDPRFLTSFWSVLSICWLHQSSDQNPFGCYNWGPLLLPCSPNLTAEQPKWLLNVVELMNFWTENRHLAPWESQGSSSYWKRNSTKQYENQVGRLQAWIHL